MDLNHRTVLNAALLIAIFLLSRTVHGVLVPTFTASIFSRSSCAVVVVGTLLSGMSTSVVTPPAAAALVALVAPASVKTLLYPHQQQVVCLASSPLSSIPQ